MTTTSKLTIRVRDINKINSIIDWCKDNLLDTEWEMLPIQPFTPDYKFTFNCPKTRIQVILQHL